MGNEHYINDGWYTLLKENLEDAISYFLPDLTNLCDFSKKVEVFDTYQPSDGQSDQGSRSLCLSLTLKSGKASRVVLTVEHQLEKKEDIPLRLYQSLFRDCDRFEDPVTSLAIITVNWQSSDTYNSECMGTTLTFKFNVFHILQAEADELKRDDRFFALAVLATQKMIEANGEPEKRGEAFLEFVDHLNTKKLDKFQKYSILKFSSHLLL
jgi:hypothetical protein